MSKNSHRRRKRKLKRKQLKLMKDVSRQKQMGGTFFRYDVEIKSLFYKNIRDSSHPAAESGRELCNKLWEVFRPYSDEHFTTEATIDFIARFWEMDLTVSLLEQGLNVECPKPGPDVCLKYDNKNIWVEAIAPQKGSGADKVPEQKDGVVCNVPNEKIILRYTSAISEKFNKYQEYLDKNILSDEEPYVIAINGCQIPSARLDFDPPRIVRSVFPIGDEYVTIDKKAMKAVDRGFQFKASVKKESGSDIMIKHFIEPDFSGVSAIIFSCSDCCNRPTNGNDWIIVHNPEAKNPLPQEWITCEREYSAILTEDTYTLKCKT